MKSCWRNFDICVRNTSMHSSISPSLSTFCCVPSIESHECHLISISSSSPLNLLPKPRSNLSRFPRISQLPNIHISLSGLQAEFTIKSLVLEEIREETYHVILAAVDWCFHYSDRGMHWAEHAIGRNSVNLDLPMTRLVIVTKALVHLLVGHCQMLHLHMLLICSIVDKNGIFIPGACLEMSARW